jgi:hypothetical protein
VGESNGEIYGGFVRSFCAERLVQCARWRRVNSPHLVELVVVGTKLPDGKTRILPDLPSDSIVDLQVDAALEPVFHNI